MIQNCSKSQRDKEDYRKFQEGLADAYHNVCETRTEVSVPESTALPGNAHQLQLLLRIATAQMQPHPTQKQALLIITMRV